MHPFQEETPTHSSRRMFSCRAGLHNQCMAISGTRAGAGNPSAFRRSAADYLVHLKAAGRSSPTIESYAGSLALLDGVRGVDIPLEALSADVLDAAVASMSAAGGADGLRRSEALCLDVSDYDAEEKTLRVKDGKGRRVRTVPVVQPLAQDRRQRGPTGQALKIAGTNGERARHNKPVMNLAFDEMKATQAAGLFLKLTNAPLNYVALIDLLYKADREALRRWGLPITTDKYVSMKFGPVISVIYNRIKASASPIARPTFWSEHIRKSQGPNAVILQSDPGNSELSPAEERLIAEVFVADGAKSPFTLADECHRSFPEWSDPGESLSPIEISDIISALGLSEDEAAHTESSIEAQRAISTLAG